MLEKQDALLKKSKMEGLVRSVKTNQAEVNILVLFD